MSETQDASRPVKTKPATISAQRLKSLVERIEKLEEERKAISGDIKDVYDEAKGTGFDVKTLRKVVGLRKMDSADRDEQATMLDLYCQALGMDGGGALIVGGELGTVGIVDDKAVKAVELLSQGLSVRAVSAETGLSKSSVGRIKQAIEKATPTAVPGEAVPQDAGTGGDGTTTTTPQLASPLRARLEATISERGTTPEVAAIARDTLGLLESGQVNGAAAVVALTVALAEEDDLRIPAFLRRPPPGEELPP